MASDSETDFPTPESLREANLEYSEEPENDDDGRPLPCPSGKIKNDIFRLSDYVDIDYRACETPSNLNDQPLGDLVEYLIEPVIDNELGRVRAIYRWITAQDLNTLSGNAPSEPATPMDYLLGIKNGTISYHQLFQDMCRNAQIATELIRGHAKHSGYEIGDAFDGEQHRGSWTAVLIDGWWHLVDVHWSSQCVSGIVGDWELLDDNGKGAKEVENEEKKIHFEYDESFFLPNPHEFIYTHCAEDEKWQLLARPVSLEEFSQMAFLRLAFFERELSLISHKKCIVQAPEGATTIELGLPPDARYRFMYKLWISTKGNEQSTSYKDQELKRFVFMENVNGRLTCNIEFPIAGRFKLELYCQDASQTQYLEVCSYVIVVESAKQDARVYPENNRHEWGPGCDLENAGLKPLTHDGGHVEMENGVAEMRFGVQDDVEILAKMTSNKRSNTDLEGFVIHRIENNEVVVNVRVPESGDYALNLYAKNRADTESKLFSNVCGYLLSAAEVPEGVTPFPNVPNGLVGASDDKIDQFGLTALSHPSGLFEADDSGQVAIVFGNPQSARLLATLGLWNDKTEQKLEGFTFIQTDGDMSTVHVRFPEKGTYSLEIYAKTGDDDDGEYSNFFTYIVIVENPMEDCRAFPKQFGKWKNDCQLISPNVDDVLFAGRKIEFSVKVPNAVDVALIDAGGTWTHLKAGNDGIWNGAVEGAMQGDLKLSALLNKDSDSYSTLLVLEVQPRTGDMSERSSSRASRASKTSKTSKGSKASRSTNGEKDGDDKERTSSRASRASKASRTSKSTNGQTADENGESSQKDDSDNGQQNEVKGADDRASSRASKTSKTSRSTKEEKADSDKERTSSRASRASKASRTSKSSKAERADDDVISKSRASQNGLENGESDNEETGSQKHEDLKNTTTSQKDGSDNEEQKQANSGSDDDGRGSKMKAKAKNESQSEDETDEDERPKSGRRDVEQDSDRKETTGGKNGKDTDDDDDEKDQEKEDKEDEDTDHEQQHEQDESSSSDRDEEEKRIKSGKTSSAGENKNSTKSETKKGDGTSIGRKTTSSKQQQQQQKRSDKKEPMTRKTESSSSDSESEPRTDGETAGKQVNRGKTSTEEKKKAAVKKDEKKGASSSSGKTAAPDDSKKATKKPEKDARQQRQQQQQQQKQQQQESSDRKGEKKNKSESGSKKSSSSSEKSKQRDDVETGRGDGRQGDKRSGAVDGDGQRRPEREKRAVDEKERRRREEEEERRRRRQEAEDEANKKDEWKRKYLEQERRKELGEFEYRRLVYRQRQEAIKASEAKNRKK